MEQLLFTIPNRVGGQSAHSVGRNGVSLFRPTDCRWTVHPVCYEWNSYCSVPNRVGGLSAHSVRDGTVTVPFLTEWVDCPPTLLGMEQLLFTIPNRVGGLSASSVRDGTVTVPFRTEWVDIPRHSVRNGAVTVQRPYQSGWTSRYPIC